MNPAYEKLLKCYDSYKAKIDFTPKVALILGSGLGDYADDIRRSEERRVGKECRSRWSPYH